MKKSVVYMLVALLLPIFAMAGVFKAPGVQELGFTQDFARAYRQSHRIYSDYRGNSWEPDSRMVPDYSEEHPMRVVAVNTDMWDEDGWMEGVMNTQLSYNAAGRVTEVISYYNIMGFQIPMLKQVSEYDAQNRLLKSNLFRGDLDTMSDWLPVIRMNIVYGTGTSFEIYTWQDDSSDEETDIYYTHTVPTFDAQGRIIEDISYTSLDSLNWVLDGRSLYVYHPQDHSTGSDLIELLASEYTTLILNEGNFLPGKVMSQTFYDRINNDWVLADRDSWEYNIPLDITSHLHEEYENNTWKARSWDQYFYDGTPLLLYVTSKWYDGSTWYDESKVEYFWDQYSDNSDLVIAAPRLDFSAQPNPFVDNLHLKADTGKNAPLSLEVYNLRGQKLYNTTANSKDIDWNGMDLQGKKLPAGVYFIRLSQDGLSGTKRVLKLK